MMKANLGFVLLFVSNPLKSSLFYQDLLEIKSVEESPTFVIFALGNGVMLGLWNKFTAEPRVDIGPGASEVCFPCDDVDALYDAWSKKHLVILQKPTDMDFGRTFVIQDPDGHRIRFYKLLGESK
ncbi:MAG: VOC family protein [Chlamydiales bacterium]